MSQLSSAQRLSAGVHAPPSLADGFATTQAAWRFYANPRVGLPTLCGPLLERARASASACCDQWMLVVLDWSNLHYNTQRARADRVPLSMKRDLGYELLTALAVGDRDGAPIAPVCLELRAGAGVQTTRCDQVLEPPSQLDGLGPVMDHVTGLSLGRPAVFVIDREADSVAHYRQWDAAGRAFLVRANGNRLVTCGGVEQRLSAVADGLAGRFKPTRRVLYKGKEARQFVAQTTVVLTRPAYQHRVGVRGEDGRRRKRHTVIPGPALALRLVVAEVRDRRGGVLARWMLLSNLPAAAVPAATLALWYYWRWRIESYHKLLKGAGQQVEQWQQQTAGALVRRLLVTAMAAVLVWQIARATGPGSDQLRDTLVKLSGRQVKRTPGAPRFTEPALLAGLGVLIPMLLLLETMSVADLKATAHDLMPLIQSLIANPRSESG